AEQEGQQTETEATGAPQKHHYTLNQQVGSITLICYERERYHGLAPLLTIRGRDLKGKERVSWLN
ncbi:hypothetical protein ACH6U0_08475, partial [Klebsiella pneumoniae]|nr:hypothetical protein [Klebsiella pneumoniae]